MKHLIFTLAIAWATLTASTPCRASNTSISTKGDTTIVIEDGDTTIVAGGMPFISNIIKRALNDTLASTEDLAEIENDNNEPIIDNFNEEAFTRRQEAMHDMVRDMMSYIVMGSVFIVFFALLFYYLHRRAKYRIMEKAIENNYPLTGTILGNQTIVTPPDPQPAQPIGSESKQPHEPLNMASSITFDQASPLINWKAFKKDFILCAIGLVAVLFFTIEGVGFLAAVSSIMLIIGGANAFVTYQDQKRLIAWQLSQAQSKPQQPTTTQQPPVFTPQEDNQPQQPQQ